MIKIHPNLIGRELFAACTTYLTMCYIIFVNPVVLASAGMDQKAVFTATCLITIFGTLLSGLLANYPIAIAPGMALNAYFTYVVVQSMHFSWQKALGAVLVSGVIFFLLTVTQIRRHTLDALPKKFDTAIATGVGLFLCLLALKNAELLSVKPGFSIQVQAFQPTYWLCFLLGLGCISGFNYWRIPGALVSSVLVISLVSFWLKLSQFHGVFARPPSLHPTLLAFDFKDLWRGHGLSIVFAFLMVALFDATGTLIGLLQMPTFAHDPAKPQKIHRILLADSLATIAGACLGTSSTSPFTESAAGMQAGGRTGLTAVFVAGLFFISMFLSPLVESIPNFAAAPALFYVGMLMAKSIRSLGEQDWLDRFPLLVTALGIPLTFSIADGLGVGLLTYLAVQVLRKKVTALRFSQLALMALFMVYFALQSW